MLGVRAEVWESDPDRSVGWREHLQPALPRRRSLQIWSNARYQAPIQNYPDILNFKKFFFDAEFLEHKGKIRQIVSIFVGPKCSIVRKECFFLVWLPMSKVIAIK